MTADRDIVLDMVTEVARENGYKPVGKVYFYKEHPEVICVLNLQRSSWGPQHYLNAGVTLTRLVTSKRPKFADFQILWRAETQPPEGNKSPLARALDLEAPMDETIRRQTITDGINRHAFAHLNACTDEASAFEVALRINAAVKQVALQSWESADVVLH